MKTLVVSTNEALAEEKKNYARSVSLVALILARGHSLKWTKQIVGEGERNLPPELFQAGGK